MRKLLEGASRLAQFIAAMMLATIFGTFLFQIVLRYFFEPVGWTLELIGILWVWVIFFSCAFIVRDRDQVKFDILYHAAPRKARTIMAMISAAAIALILAYSFLPTWDYIDWMKIRKTTAVENPFTGEKIRMRTIFSIYAVFLIAVVIRYALRFVRIWREGPPKTELELVLDDLNYLPEGEREEKGGEWS